MTFAEYLLSKKIDAQAFKENEMNLYEQWEREFGQMHPNSFTMQKLNMINPVRRKYQLRESPAGVTPAEPSVPKPTLTQRVVKPVIKPKMKPDENVQ